MSSVEIGVFGRRRELGTLAGALASIRLSVDGSGRNSRLIVEDVATGEELELGVADFLAMLESHSSADSWTAWRRA